MEPATTAIDEREGNNHTKPDKIAMSKALGQAFLSHQVRKLEEDAGGRGRGSNRRGSFRTHSDMNYNARNAATRRGAVHAASHNGTAHPIPKAPSRIVLDTSVLIHALDQVRKWCSPDNETKIVIPLEGVSSGFPRPASNPPPPSNAFTFAVLNSLDLLKKGNSSISVYARAASRLLEEQVGANSRITVQEDAAVADWPGQTEDEKAMPIPPQWLINTLGCVLWEQAHSSDSIALAVMDEMIPSNEPVAKFDQRAEGSQVREWARRVGIPLISISQRSRPEIYKPEIRRNARAPNDTRLPQNRKGKYGRPGSGGGRSLVEKPAAPTPSTGVRLLARGEMLAP